MKRIFALLTIALMFSIQSFAGDTTDTKVDTSKITVTKVYGDVKTALVALGSALKVGTEHVYKVLVTQSIVEALVYVVLFILGIIASLICYNRVKKALLEYESEDGDDGKGNTNVVFAVVWGIAGVIMLMVFVFNLGATITGLFNPEYGALNKIISLIK